MWQQSIKSKSKYWLQYIFYTLLTEIRFAFLQPHIKKRNEGKICILLTSYPLRHKTMKKVLKNLASLNEFVHIYLSIYEGDQDFYRSDKRFFSQISNLTLVYVPNDTKSYKKIAHLEFALKNYQYCVICDDDVYYPRNFVTKLINKSENSSCDVVCGLSHKFIKQNEQYNWIKYTSGHLEQNSIMNGVAGILINSQASISNERLRNLKYLDICPNNDDLWISLYLLDGLQKFSINRGLYFNWIYDDPNALYQINSSGRLEDELSLLLDSQLD